MNDLDTTVIRVNDDPLIPNGVTNPPIHEVIEWKKKLENSKK